MLSRSAVPNPSPPHGLQPARHLCPWGFSRQEYWSGLPCPPAGDLPNPGIEFRNPTLPLPKNHLDSLPSEPPGKPRVRASYLTFLGFCFDLCEVGLMMHSPSERQAVRDGLSPHRLRDDGPTGGHPSLCDQSPPRAGGGVAAQRRGWRGAKSLRCFISSHLRGRGLRPRVHADPGEPLRPAYALCSSPGSGVLGLRGGKVRSSRKQVPHPAPAPRLCLRE